LKRKAVTHLVENFITDSWKQRSLISQHTHLQKAVVTLQDRRCRKAPSNPI